MASVDIPRTFGALLIGGLFATFLSGAVSLQALVYLKLFPLDGRQLKGLLFVVWFLDTLHTVFIWLSLWTYLIDWFGQSPNINMIHWSLSVTIIVTAILTFLVHCFFAQRIFKLSRGSYIWTIPIVVLAVLRVASATVTTGKMLQLGNFPEFKAKIGWIFTTGLALSTAVDIFITGSLFLLLHTSRMGITSSSDINVVIDSLIKYTFETGAMTCAGTIVAMILWIALPNNLIFMGLHFVIGKFYANSLLVTLITRQNLRNTGTSSSKDLPLPVRPGDHRRRSSNPYDTYISAIHSQGDMEGKVNKAQALQVNVERSVVFLAE